MFAGFDDGGKLKLASPLVICRLPDSLVEACCSRLEGCSLHHARSAADRLSDPDDADALAKQLANPGLLVGAHLRTTQPDA
jgi:hypothetical protein